MNTVNKRDPQTYSIIGAAMEIHRQLGHGFLEAVYQEAAVLEFPKHNIPFQREVPLPIIYKGTKLPTSYRADFICFSEIVVEFKALTRLTSTEESQVLNYLKATGFYRGLLINFGTKSLKYKRFVWGYPDKKICKI
ncbi:MAG: GxxExxY protein [Anaerolineales bacterium]|uniref:GxxExxY protein n=1 Tax=Candidatus Desulfolinea nitratireducens TaxID=2841698 RepID=A0A8J6TEX5_9CHLR|nr:GxxExxY protein [Candidatus Desulfolinea nitratireducens]MBL6959693.1 GxxExxY protein [Anaerolineales bacterium]